MLEHQSKQRNRKLLGLLGKIMVFFLIVGLVAYRSTDFSMAQQDNAIYEENKQSEEGKVSPSEVPSNEDSGDNPMADQNQPQEASDNTGMQDGVNNAANADTGISKTSLDFPVITEDQALAFTDEINTTTEKTDLKLKGEKNGTDTTLDNQDLDTDEENVANDQQTQQYEEVVEQQEEDNIPSDSEQQTSDDMDATQYTLGYIADVIDKMNRTEGMQCKFTWDEEKFTEDSLFIDYIRDVMDRWYDEGRISRKWEPNEERFTSETPYYTAEQAGSRMLANLMYGEEGVLFWYGSFDAAILANLFAGSVAMNRVTDANGRFGSNLNDVIFTGGGYANTTRQHVRNESCQREIIYILAEMIIQYGPIGPEDLIYQARFTQGSEIFAEIDGEYFCLE